LVRGRSVGRASGESRRRLLRAPWKPSGRWERPERPAALGAAFLVPEGPQMVAGGAITGSPGRTGRFSRPARAQMKMNRKVRWLHHRLPSLGPSGTRRIRCASWQIHKSAPRAAETIGTAGLRSWSRRDLRW
jgi:hypothetical protein